MSLKWKRVRERSYTTHGPIEEYWSIDVGGLHMDATTDHLIVAPFHEITGGGAVRIRTRSLREAKAMGEALARSVALGYRRMTMADR